MLETDHLLRYWIGGQWAANVLMLMHLLGAMLLGLLLGYERAYTAARRACAPMRWSAWRPAA